MCAEGPCRTLGRAQMVHSVSYFSIRFSLLLQHLTAFSALHVLLILHKFEALPILGFSALHTDKQADQPAAIYILCNDSTHHDLAHPIERFQTLILRDTSKH